MRRNTKEDILKNIQPSGECALWQGDTYRNGYGRTRWAGRMWRVHRLIWTLAFGAIPNGLYVLHKNDCNRMCCNLKHLYLGTPQDNMDDRERNGRTIRGDAHWTRKGAQ